MESNIITANRANYGGGGIFTYYDGITMIDNFISENWSLYAGGGVYIKWGSGTWIERCLIVSNSSQNGAGIYIGSHSGAELINCTISQNTAEVWGGGLYSTTFSAPEVHNSIIWGNTGQEHANVFISYSDTISIHYSDIAGGWEGVGNIDGDPLFSDPNNGDFNLTWNNYPFEDSTKSPCIDAGNPEQEYNDPDGTRCDMGALYFSRIMQPIEDLTIDISVENVILKWMGVPGASVYNIYCGDSPYMQIGSLPDTTIFPPDTSIIFPDAALELRKFYIITAEY